MAVTKIKLIFVLVFLLPFIFINLSLSYSPLTFTFTEGDLIKINSTVVDPDQDNLLIYYAPPLNESGEWQTTLNDAGTYYTSVVASDGKSQTKEEITIIVKNKNQHPEIKKKKIIVEENQTIDLKQLISDPDNDTLKLIFQAPFNKEGIWTPSYEDAGNLTTKITASDLEFKATRTIEIEIKNKNRPPEIISSFSDKKIVFLTEDSVMRFNVSARDLDNDPLSYSWQLDGEEISRKPSFSHYFGFESSGEHKLTFIVSDHKSKTEKNWTLKVKNLNRPPQIEQPDIIVDEGEKIILQLPDADIDGDPLEYNFSSPFKNNTWQTTYEDAGNYTILITATDGELTGRKKIKVTVNDVDRPPQINLDKEITLDENQQLKLNLDDFISDPDNDKISISIKNLPPGANFSDNRIKWRPSYNFVQRKSNFFSNFLNKLRLEKYFFSQNKKIDLFITACGKKLCSNQTLEIKVNNLNRKPLLGKIKNVTLTETDTLILKPKAVDSDNDYIKYHFAKPFNSKGEWQTNLEDAGNYNFTVTASDGYLTDSQEVSVTVLNKNLPPTLNIKKDYFKLNENQPLSFKITASDPDNDPLNISAEDLPPGASFKDQIFSWIPSFETVQERRPTFFNNLYARSSFFNRRFNKEYKQFTINFVASDGHFDMVHPVLITVKNMDRPPQVADYSPAQEIIAVVGKPVTFSADFNDFDGDNLTYQWSFAFWEKTVSGSNTLQRTFKTPGYKTIKVQASDGTYSAEHRWTVNVEPLPTLPLPENAPPSLAPSEPQPIPPPPPKFNTYVVTW